MSFNISQLDCTAMNNCQLIEKVMNRDITSKPTNLDFIALHKIDFNFRIILKFETRSRQFIVTTEVSNIIMR